MLKKTDKILIFNWKDIKHPKAGGAEIVTHKLAKEMVKNGNEVTLITAKYKNSSKLGEIDGIKIVRLGNIFTHYPLAILYYIKNLKDKFEIIIEEVNTIPYFINFFKGKEQVFLYYNMLAREIWFYEFFKPLSILGFLIEPFYTWIQSRFENTILTISESSKQDLIKFGFKPEKIKIFGMWTEQKPLLNIQDSLPKEDVFTILFHGSLRNMKRPIEVLKSYKIFLEILKKENKDKNQTQLWISGGGDIKELENYSWKQEFLEKVKFFGRTTNQEKLDLMQKATVLAATSLKEGWGLIVTEANSMGTPAIALDVDGLRDSAGLEGNFVVENKAQKMAEKFYELFQVFKNKPKEYQKIREKALKSSQKLTFEKAYQEFIEIISS
jgi:glycosyltransferase involved in cell wall biosynthesis